jgi:uncharacterized protein YicC (UPF0701 family)
MTGFGRADGPNGLAAEVRTVNSRHLEVRVRLPRELAALERDARAVASRFFERGGVDIAVRLPQEGELAPRLELDLDAARRYASAAQELAAGLGIASDLTAARLLTLPAVARVREPIEPNARAGAADTIARACAAAECAHAGESLRELRRSRPSRHGAGRGRAAAVLDRRAARSSSPRRASSRPIRAPRAGGRPVLTRTSPRGTCACATTSSSAETRSKAAVRAQARSAQELGRETNTLAASPPTRCSRAGGLKTELEKLREQVLNLE